MLISIIAILAGFALLVWGADKFVQGASATASNLGVSPLIIGLTIVGFGTSAPEMLVSFMAALNGNPEIAVGNAIGSNITNIGLVLGITAMIVPLTVNSSILKREYPIMFAVMILAWYLMSDNTLQKTDGVILIFSMFFVLALVTFLGLRDQKNTSDPLNTEFNEEIPTDMSTKMAMFWLFFGLLILVGSSKILVWGAVNIAHNFGVSDLVIGLTIIAIGTSLPELAASVVSALKGEHEIAIGNIIGSNMFNLLGVLGIPALISPINELSETVLNRDYPVMIGLSILLLFFAYGFTFGKKQGKDPVNGKITRLESSILLLGYATYMYLIYLSIQT
ncbi:MAG: calcium/sodium antiporter [Pseudomonadota bacterium]